MDFMQSLTLESATEKDARPLPRLMPRLHVKAFSGGAIVLIFIFMGIFGPAASAARSQQARAHGDDESAAGHRRAHVLGTDNLGRDILSRVISRLAGIASDRLCGGFRFGIYRHQARCDLGLFRRQSRFLDSKTGRSRLGFSAAACSASRSWRFSAKACSI